jgi:hypothetical protein
VGPSPGERGRAASETTQLIYNQGKAKANNDPPADSLHTKTSAGSSSASLENSHRLDASQ